MKILGINYSAHDVSIAYIKDGHIECVLEEEKFRGIKSVDMQWQPPSESMKFLFDRYGLNKGDFDHIVFSRPTVQSYLRNFDQGKISFYSHHKCHALGSYFTSGFSGKCISFSHDGKGELSRGKIFLCEDGKYEEIHSQPVSTTASLAGIWGLSTILLGWRMLKDEGKVVGLAAHGEFDPQIYSWLKGCIDYDGNLSFSPAGWEHRFWFTFNRHKEKFNDNKFRSNFAFTLEILTEELIRNLLKDLSEKYPNYRNLCLSGGLFANVKLNQMINNLDYFDEVFIHPAMGDSGLSLGAALIKCHEVGDIKSPVKLENVYLGQDFSKEDWNIELNKKLDSFCVEPYSLETIAKLIDEGFVLGLFLGKTEYGPRALGNRSIIVKPTEPGTHERLNRKLKRSEVMPFAPSVLEEYSGEIFGVKKSSYTAEFMTMCYGTSDDWLQKLPAVVQMLDKSARPQVVKKSSNPIYYGIIDSYRKLSGIPVVLNTSFNAHGEPINNYPHQVLKHLEEEVVDFIVTEDYLISKK